MKRAHDQVSLDDQAKDLLFQATRDGDVRRIEEAMNNHGAEVLGSLRNSDDQALLHVAAESRHLDIVRLLIEQGAHGADINKANGRGQTPFYIACRGGNLEIARLLIQHHADVNKADDSGETPIYDACQTGELEVACLLIQHQADINKASDSGMTPLYHACLIGNLEVARFLIQHHADVNKANNWGETPLYVACWSGNLEIARLLIQHHADINKAADSDMTPLAAACVSSNSPQTQLDIVEELVRHISQHRSIG